MSNSKTKQDSDVISKMLNSYLPKIKKMRELEEEHLLFLRERLEIAKEWNEKWYNFIPMDEDHIRLSIVVSERFLEHCKQRQKEYQEFVITNW